MVVAVGRGCVATAVVQWRGVWVCVGVLRPAAVAVVASIAPHVANMQWCVVVVRVWA